MEIIGYILYGILILFTLGSMWGVREKLALGCPTIIGSLYFLILNLIFVFKDINYLHLIWSIPLVYILTLLTWRLYIYKPIIKIFNPICSLYVGILRIGISKEKIEVAKEIRKQELKQELDKIANKKFKKDK